MYKLLSIYAVFIGTDSGFSDEQNIKDLSQLERELASVIAEENLLSEKDKPDAAGSDADKISKLFNEQLVSRRIDAN